MKIKMTRKEYDCYLYAKRFTNNWDYYILASDAFLAGYNQARQDGLPGIQLTGNEELEIDFTDGEHQLSSATFQKWKKERA